jgi:hypothetical protein
MFWGVGDNWLHTYMYIYDDGETMVPSVLWGVYDGWVTYGERPLFGSLALFDNMQHRVIIVS